MLLSPSGFVCFFLLLCLPSSIFSTRLKWEYVIVDGVGTAQQGANGSPRYSPSPQYPGAVAYPGLTWFNNLLYFHGGLRTHINNDRCKNDLWQWNPLTSTWHFDNLGYPDTHTNDWNSIPYWVGGNGFPGARGAHVFIATENQEEDPINRAIFVFGGFGWSDGTFQLSIAFLQDVWIYTESSGYDYVSGSTLGALTWYNRLETSSYPGGRAYTAAWAVGSDTFYIWGGWGCDESSSDVQLGGNLWRWNRATSTWSEIVAGGAPSARDSPSAWLVRPANGTGDPLLYLFGGYVSSSVQIQDLYYFDVVGGAWTTVSSGYDGSDRGLYATDGTGYPGGRAEGGVFGIHTGSPKGLVYAFLFAGRGYGHASSASGLLGDVWWYESEVESKWYWVDNRPDETDSSVQTAFGADYSVAPLRPGQRHYARAAFRKSTGTMYIYGGEHDHVDPFGTKQDLWKMVLTCADGLVADDTWHGVCSSRGSCTPSVSRLCTCDQPSLYAGDWCQYPICYGVHEGIGAPCDGHGECVSPDVCLCDSTHGGDTCNETVCWGIPRGPLACSGPDHGDCYDKDVCHCLPNWAGPDCQVPGCDYIAYNESGACSDHGSCDDSGTGVCTCSGIWEGQFCDTERTCFMILHSLSSVCSGNGECSSQDYCSCDLGWSGGNCEVTSCGGIASNSTDENLCNGRGVCLAFDLCSCTAGVPPLCGDAVKGGGAAAAVGATLGVLALICIVLIIIVVVVAIFLAYRYRDRLGKVVRVVKNLDDVNVILDEHDAQKKSMRGTPTFEVSSALFTIKYDEVKLEEMLETGGSNSQVYYALWNGQDVAFKVFGCASLSQADFSEFEREISLLSSISHPFEFHLPPSLTVFSGSNIVRFYGCCLQSPRVGIVMEYCKHQLDRFVMFHKPPLTTERRLRIIFQISEAMQYLHARDIMHRDLKAANIMLDENEVVKLIDFGLSRAAKDSVDKTVRVGTCSYMAPEVVFGGDYDLKCDVFSFGILAFEVATGQFPAFGKGKTRIGMELQIANDPTFRPVMTTDQKLQSPRWVRQLLEQCWDHDPHVRPAFPEIKQMIEEKAGFARVSLRRVASFAHAPRPTLPPAAATADDSAIPGRQRRSSTGSSLKPTRELPQPPGQM